MPDKDIDIRIKVDAKGAISVLDKTGKEIEKLEGATKKAGKSTEHFQKRISDMGRSLVTGAKRASLYVAGITAIGAAAAAVSRKIITTGSTISDINRTFDEMALKAGYVSDILLDKFVNAIGGTVTQLDAMKKLNELLVAGVDPQHYELIAAAARKLAETGVEASDALYRITNSLITGETETIRRLGVIVDLEKAQGALADQFGRTKQELTALGRIESSRRAMIEGLTAASKDMNAVTDDAADEINRLTASIGDNFNQLLALIGGNEDLAIALKRVNNMLESMAFQELVDDIAKATSAVLTFAATAVAGLSKVKRFIDLWTDSDLSLDEIFAVMALEDLVGQIKKEFMPTFEEAKAKTDDVKKSSEELEKAWFALGDTASGKLKKDVKEVTNEFEKLNDEFEQLERAAFARVKEWGERTGGTAGAKKGGGLLGLDADTVEDLKRDLQHIGGDLVDGIYQGIKEGFDSQDWQGLVGDIGGQIGGSIGYAFGGPIGEAVGSIIGEELFSGIFDLFDSSNAGDEARKAIDRWFADVLANSNITTLVEGELVRISDMTFSNYGSDAFKGLPEAAQGAFAAVGAAYEQMLGEMGYDTEEITGQLGAIFANNLGGSISDLRMLIEATGQSAEAMGDALMRAFLQGQMSAVDFMNALRAIESTTARGIPESIGAVGEAWERVIQAGFEGGRALLDAIASVGVEAVELGAHTFPELGNVMINTFGISAERVTQFMAAMAAAGVETLEQLADASNETLAAIAANMQALQEGRTADYTPINLEKPSYTAPKSSAISRGASGAQDADALLQKRVQKIRQQADAIWALVEGTAEYQTLIEEVIAGTREYGDAQELINKLFEDAKDLLDEYTSLQRRYERQLERAASAGNKRARRRAKDRAEAIRAEISVLDMEMSQFGKTSEQSGETTLDWLRSLNLDMEHMGVAATALGESLQGLTDEAIRSFLFGKISAGEAIAIFDEATGGIPNVIGGIDIAFQKLIESGTSGGAFTLKALRGIGIEALEIGHDTLDELYNFMRAKEIPSDQVDKFFAALHHTGITSVQGIAEAGDEIGIRMIAWLDQLGFGFQETRDEMKQWLADLDSQLAKKREMDLVINVSTNYEDEGAEEIMEGTAYGDDSPGIISKNERGILRSIRDQLNQTQLKTIRGAFRGT